MILRTHLSLLGWVHLPCQQLARVVAAHPRLLERDVGELSKGRELFRVRKAVLEAPELAAGRRYEEEQAAAVGQLYWSLAGLGGSQRCI